MRKSTNKDDYLNEDEFDNNSSNDVNNRKNKINQFSTKGKIVGTIFILIFIISVLGMIYFSSTKPSMSVFLVGLTFFFAGIYLFTTVDLDRKTMLFLIFPFGGAGMMIFSGIYTFGNSENKAFVLNMLPFLIAGTLFLVGATIILHTISINKYNKTYCTESVMAECIEVKSQYDEGTKLYCPVYSFYYNGKAYEVCNEEYNNVVVPKINEKYEIFINPDKPTEYYTQSSAKSFVKIFLGVLLMIIPTLIAVYYLFYNNV